MISILVGCFVSIFITAGVVVWSCRKAIGKDVMITEIKAKVKNVGHEIDRVNDDGYFVSMGTSMAISAGLLLRYAPRLVLAHPQLRTIYVSYVIVGSLMSIAAQSRLIYKERDNIKRNSKRIYNKVKSLPKNTVQRLRKRYSSKRNA